MVGLVERLQLFGRWAVMACGAVVCIAALHGCATNSSTAVSELQLRQIYITPHFAKCPPVSR